MVKIFQHSASLFIELLTGQDFYCHVKSFKCHCHLSITLLFSPWNLSLAELNCLSLKATSCGLQSISIKVRGSDSANKGFQGGLLDVYQHSASPFNAISYHAQRANHGAFIFTFCQYFVFIL